MPKKKVQKRKGGTRKIGRSARPIRWPLMPDGLTPRQAWAWYTHRYEH